VHAIYLPLVVPLIAAVAARPLAERPPPRTAAWLLAGSALTLAAVEAAGHLHAFIEFGQAAAAS
jgi:hypothetical protein